MIGGVTNIGETKIKKQTDGKGQIEGERVRESVCERERRVCVSV